MHIAPGDYKKNGNKMNDSTKISAEKLDDVIRVVVPYHPEFVRRARMLGGRFVDGAWVFDELMERHVKDVLCNIYGTDGSSVELVDVRMKLNAYGCRKEVWELGRLIVERTDRDCPARLGGGVILESGGFSAIGGSIKYPLIDSNDAVVLVHDVPRMLAERAASEKPEVFSVVPTSARELSRYSTQDLIEELAKRGVHINQDGG